MDDDVKLSMKQAHEKWILKMVTLGSLLVLSTLAFCVHDCNKSAELCQDAVVSGTVSGVLKCPDARQTLAFPPGWTWAKCTCPKAENAAPQ